MSLTSSYFGLLGVYVKKPKLCMSVRYRVWKENASVQNGFPLCKSRVMCVYPGTPLGERDRVSE